jgi:surface polysaccharide O-acyltransferase-like enzyme
VAADQSARQRQLKRLSWAALSLVFVPLIVEALALEPAELLHFREPIQAAFSLVLLNALPYFAVALSAAVLAASLRRQSLSETTVRHGSSIVLALFAMAMAFAAAFSVRSFSELLLAGELHISGDRLVLGEGGPLAPSLPLGSVALEQAGGLFEREVPGRASPWTATVRWIGVRTSEQSLKGTRVDLIAGDSSIDVTSDFASLRPGEARVFSRNVRLGPEPARVRLRLAQDPLPPIDFFSADYESDARGVAIDVGGSDQAYRTALPTGSLAAGGARFAIAGNHAVDGYAVVVLSGDEWRRHDVSGLLERRGRLQLRFTEVDASAWSVRLVGDGVQSDAVPLTRFARTTRGDESQYSLPLENFSLGKVPATAVVGVALTYIGAPGPFTLKLLDAEAALPDAPATGVAIATTAALDPGVRPAQAWFAVGQEPASSSWRSHLFEIRLAAGLLALIAIIGAAGSWQLVMARPVIVALALVSAPLLSVVLPPTLKVFAEPRVEQLPLALALLTIALLVGTRLPAAKPFVAAALPATAQDSQKRKLMWIDALKGLGILGVIGIHVTADPAGLPYAAFAPPERIAPAVLRAFATGLNYPIFLIASLFLLAHTLESRAPNYPTLIRDRLRRLMLPFLAWTAIYVLFRFIKAAAFGYTEAYRQELAHGESWLEYLLLGSAQYHLHFLPLLMGLVLFFPLFRPARRNPAWALLLLPLLLLWPLADGLAYQHVASPEWRNFALRVTKTAAYLGYGLFAFALYGMWRDERLAAWRRPLLGGAVLLAVATLAVLVHAAFDVAAAGQWLPNTLTMHMARYLAPPSLFVLLLLSSSLRWPQWLLKLGGLSFGIYLFHPVILDLLEILERGTGMPPIWTVTLNFVTVVVLSVAVAVLCTRQPSLRWMFGLNSEHRR